MSESIFEDLSAQVRVPGDGEKVFKDECPFSFETPETEKGIYICMRHFVAIGSKILRLYYEKTGCRAFLRYKIEKQFKDKGMFLIFWHFTSTFFWRYEVKIVISSFWVQVYDRLLQLDRFLWNSWFYKVICTVFFRVVYTVNVVAYLFVGLFHITHALAVLRLGRGILLC